MINTSFLNPYLNSQWLGKPLSDWIPPLKKWTTNLALCAGVGKLGAEILCHLPTHSAYSMLLLGSLGVGLYLCKNSIYQIVDDFNSLSTINKTFFVGTSLLVTVIAPMLVNSMTRFMDTTPHIALSIPFTCILVSLVPWVRFFNQEITAIAQVAFSSDYSLYRRLQIEIEFVRIERNVWRRIVFCMIFRKFYTQRTPSSSPSQTIENPS